MRRWVTLFVLVVACAEPVRGVMYTEDAGGDADPVDGGRCVNDRACDDLIACTVDRCRAGACVHEPCTDCCPEGLQCVARYGCGRPPRACANNADCADGIRCTLDACTDARVCENTPQADLCSAGEVCLAAVGCLPRPPDRCATDAECATTPCSGSWRCQAELGCGFRAPVDCDDQNACTVDSCSNARGGCQHTPRDRDGDGHGDRACGGDDCDDNDRARHPGAMEVCGNRVDDDCDGAADDGCCGAAMSCTTSCGSPGTTSCTAMGTPGPCMPGPETCNGRDDNCDGMVDNGFSCARGNVVACMTPCGTAGSQVCSDACTLGACTPPMEACNGRDDNCDGRTDEGCCSTATPCTTTCGSMGVTTCNAAGMPTGCRPPAETCNRRDDDCDGMVDNGFTCIAGSMGTCMTACGSVGQRACNGACAWDACVPPAEACNGRDDNCDGRTDEGCCSATSACMTTCGSSGTTICNAMGMPTGCRAPAEACNGRDDDCDRVVDNGFACAPGATGACTTACGSTGSRRCLASCAWDTCAPPAEVCNGADDNCNAACDEGFMCCARSTRACSALGFVSGTATCRADCGGWDTSGCNNCGNGRVDAGEQCDGTAFGSATCVSLGFGAGPLGCRANCTFDTSSCPSCGNGRIDGGEQCDGAALGGATCTSIGMGFTGGTLACRTSCLFDTARCTAPFTPTGAWLVSPAVTYSCAFGLVSYSFGALSFSDSGADLTVSGGGVNCAMRGASARTSRMVDVQCTLPGSCTETYRLTGTFTSNNAFMGTFTATFAGGAACFGCATRTAAVSATRM